MSKTAQEKSVRLPCSCKSNRVFCVGNSIDGGYAYYCRECGMESPAKLTKQDAIDAWNLMVSAPDLLSALSAWVHYFNALEKSNSSDPIIQQLIRHHEGRVGDSRRAIQKAQGL